MSDARQCGCHDADGEEEQDGQDGIALPFGAAFVGVDVDVRHASGDYLGVRWDVR